MMEFKNVFFSFLFASIALVIFSLPLNGQVMINEFSCSNFDQYQDNYGRYEDWIEIYNASATPYDISGYHLSDRINNPTKWEFPQGVVVPANGHLRVWASRKDEFAAGQVHTNFKLSQRKANPEFIVFADPSGNILESYNLHNHITLTNHSYGRTTDGASTWSVFTNPTFGSSNNSSVAYDRYTEIPEFDVQGGFYNGPVTVNITTNETNAVIRYTTNGTEPTPTSDIYNGPLTINSTTVVKARVFHNDNQILPGLYEFNTYFIDVSHSVPVVSVSGTGLLTLFGGTQIRPHGSVEYFEDMEFKTKVTGEFNKHGNDSWSYGQRGVDFISRDDFGYGNALHHKIFAGKSRTEFQRVMWKAGANDNYPFESGGAHIRDAFVQTLSQRGNLHLDERTYEPAILYVNGQYWGVYETREKIDDKDFTEYYYGQRMEDVYYLKTWGGTWANYGGQAAFDDWNLVRNFALNNDLSVEANYNFVRARIDLKSFADHKIINTYIVAMDWLNWNTKWWRGTNPSGEQLRWRYTLWDMDAVFGHYINYTGIPNTSPTADPCFAEALPNPGGQGHSLILNKLLDESDVFRQYYLSRYADLMNTIFSCDYMIDLLDELLDRIEPEMQGQFDRWGGNYNGWQNNVNSLKSFILARCDYMAQGMEDCYDMVGPYDVVVDIEPAGAGIVKFNTLTLFQFPYMASYFGNLDNLLEALPAGNYTFDYWELNNNIVLPNDTTANIVLNFTEGDTIIAHFKEIVPPVDPDPIPDPDPDPDPIPDPDPDPIPDPEPDPEPIPEVPLEVPYTNMTAFPTVTSDVLTIAYQLPENMEVQMKLFNITGQLMADLLPDNMVHEWGIYDLEFNFRSYGLAPGMYFIYFKTPDFRKVTKIIYMD